MTLHVAAVGGQWVHGDKQRGWVVGLGQNELADKLVAVGSLERYGFSPCGQNRIRPYFNRWRSLPSQAQAKAGVSSRRQANICSRAMPETPP
jgi:hypothetical protein